MNRYFVMAVAGLIALGAWFALPGGGARAADQPLVVDLSPADAIGKVRALPLQDSFRRESITGGFETFASQLTLKHDDSGVRNEVASLWHGADKVLVIRIAVRPEGSSTALDISAELPGSPLTSHDVLSPSDRKVLATVADLVVTDYVAVMLQGQAPGSSADIQESVDALAGFSEADHQAFAARVRQAVKKAYAITPPATAQRTEDLADGDDDAAIEGGGPGLDPAPDSKMGVPDPATPDDPGGSA
ncbi:MAG: hypothetical protein ABIT09_04955 [Croceibacterium sp.]